MEGLAFADSNASLLWWSLRKRTPTDSSLVHPLPLTKYFCFGVLRHGRYEGRKRTRERPSTKVGGTLHVLSLKAAGFKLRPAIGGIFGLRVGRWRLRRQETNDARSDHRGSCSCLLRGAAGFSGGCSPGSAAKGSHKSCWAGRCHCARNSGRCMESSPDGGTPSAIPAPSERRVADRLHVLPRVRSGAYCPTGRLHHVEECRSRVCRGQNASGVAGCDPVRIRDHSERSRSESDSQAVRQTEFLCEWSGSTPRKI